MKLVRVACVLAGAAGLALTAALFGPAQGQQIHRDGFEANEPVWVKGPADVPFKEIEHAMTEEHAHGGQRSEFIHIEAGNGTSIQYTYDIGRAPVGEELTASVWLRANRPGVQLMARLVLPRERNPKSIDQPLTAIIRGDRYEQAGRWWRTELRSPVKLLKNQQQMLRVELKRDVDITDAYIDQLILNVYPGPGETQVWIDDLEIGPLAEASPFRTTSRPTGGSSIPLPGNDRPAARRTAAVELKQDKLYVGGKRFFIRGIRYTDTPLKTLRDAGFNTVWLDENATPELMDQAANLGFWIVPTLSAKSNDPALVSDDLIGKKLTSLTAQDAILMYDIGSGATLEQLPTVTRFAELIKSNDRGRLLGLDVWDGPKPYARTVQLIGVHRWPLMTALELPQYREWIYERRLLGEPDRFTWTWIQTHLPDWYTNLVYEHPSREGFKEPVGPQPEQIRLLAYTALGAGCRGLGFWSDRFLADSHQGRDRLLEMALLNQEFQLLEPLLAAADAPTWIDTSIPEIKAAVFRSERGMLVLPMWIGAGAQFCPGQSAKSRLEITVPNVPIGAHALEVTPGDVITLRAARVTGGVKVTLPEFGLTTAIVFTGDYGPTGLLVHFQNQTRRMRRIAAQWAHDLAVVELDKVVKVNEQLEKEGHRLPDGDALLKDARERVKNCVDLWNEGDFRESYFEANRALRPMRILMRAQWELATKELDSPVASPYAVSFYTLPRHWPFYDQVKNATAGANVLPGGDFETDPTQSPQAWVAQEVNLDQKSVELAARRVTDEPHAGAQCLMLEIKAKTTPGPDGKAPPAPAALERTFLAIHSPVVHLAPGTLVRISAWVRNPGTVAASADGALMYDSAGGEPLAIRLTTELKKWRKVTLYRRVPASGAINVTLALTGLGKIYFDDVRIEPLMVGATPLAQTNGQTAQTRP
jgi:hypothetical protein